MSTFYRHFPKCQLLYSSCSKSVCFSSISHMYFSYIFVNFVKAFSKVSTSKWLDWPLSRNRLQWDWALWLGWAKHRSQRAKRLVRSIGKLRKLPLGKIVHTGKVLLGNILRNHSQKSFCAKLPFSAFAKLKFCAIPQFRKTQTVGDGVCFLEFNSGKILFWNVFLLVTFT